MEVGLPQIRGQRAEKRRKWGWEVILYARHSPRPGQDCDSCDKQMADLKKWAKDNDHIIRGEYRDEYVSGTVRNDGTPPPGMCDAIVAMRAGWVLACRDVSRICRDVSLMVEFERRVKQKGGKIHTLSEHANWDDPQAVFLYRIHAAFAEYQRKFTAEITRAKMRQYQKEGRVMSSKPPYGWRKVAHGKSYILVPDDREQEILVDMCRKWEDGWTIKDLERWLKKEGILARSQKPFHYTVLRKIIARYKSGENPNPDKFADQVRSRSGDPSDPVGNLLPDDEE